MPEADTRLLDTWISLKAENAQARAANTVYVLAAGEARGTSVAKGAGAADEVLSPPLPASAGGGTSGGMEPWQPAIDRVTDKLDDQFRWLLGAFGGGFAFLLVAFATGFLILTAKVDGGVEKIGTKIDALAAQVSQSNERVARLEGAQDSKPSSVK